MYNISRIPFLIFVSNWKVISGDFITQKLVFPQTHTQTVEQSIVHLHDCCTLISERWLNGELSSDDLAALHQAGKSARGWDADTPGMELNLRVCSCTGLQELLYLDRLSMTMKGMVKLSAHSLSLPVSSSHIITISVSLSLCCHNIFFCRSFLSFVFVSIASIRISILSLSAHSVCHLLPLRPETHD